MNDPYKQIDKRDYYPQPKKAMPREYWLRRLEFEKTLCVAQRQKIRLWWNMSLVTLAVVAATGGAKFAYSLRNQFSSDAIIGSCLAFILLGGLALLGLYSVASSHEKCDDTAVKLAAAKVELEYQASLAECADG